MNDAWYNGWVGFVLGWIIIGAIAFVVVSGPSDSGPECEITPSGQVCYNIP